MKLQLCLHLTVSSAIVPCQFTRADIVFIVDSSKSICPLPTDVSCSNWAPILNFIRSFITTFNVDAGYARFGLVTYSNSAINRFFLNTHNNALNLMSAVSAIPYESGSTNLQNLTSALFVTRTVQFTPDNGDRLGAPNIAVVLTNGQVGVDSVAVSL